MATLYGYLHSWPDFGENAAKTAHSGRSKLIETIENRRDFDDYTRRALPRYRGWNLFDYLSPRPLMGEELDMVEGPYPYPFYLYHNPFTGNVLIGSIRYNITNRIVEILNFALKTNMLRLSIDVDKITKEIMDNRDGDKEKRYFVSSLQLDVNGFGSKLESIILNGSDIIDSGFLERFESTDYTARQIGLRHYESELESARLLNNGGIQFYSDRLRSVEQALGYVNDVNGFIENMQL